MKTYKKGKFVPRNPGKYRGDVNNITFRSSWELKAFEFLDGNVNILQWGSEIVAIPYIKPENLINYKNGKHRKPIVSRYFPDLWIRVRKTDGTIVEEIIEIKPVAQTRPSTKRNSKTRLYENNVYEINKAKWIAAQKWCSSRDIKFRILTELSSFSNYLTPTRP